MKPKEAADLEGVERTMLLPLWGRHSESLKPHGLIHDQKCLELVERAGIDLETLAGRQNPASRLAWVARARAIDRELQDLHARHGRLTVLSLGAGLDTAFWRLGKEDVLWYDMDLPEVIALRRRWLGEHPACRLIAGSALDGASYRDITVAGCLIILAVGLLYYFDAPAVRSVLEHLAALCARAAPGRRATLVIDFCSAKGVELANRLVLGDNPGARMVWSVESDGELAALHPSIGALESWPLFRDLQGSLSEPEATMARQSDQLRVMSFARMELQA